jgi:hypothetical protein
MSAVNVSARKRTRPFPSGSYSCSEVLISSEGTSIPAEFHLDRALADEFQRQSVPQIRPTSNLYGKWGLHGGLDIHYDLGEGHPLLGRRMPDLDLVTADGVLRVFTLLHDAKPVLLNLGEPGGFDIAPWADRVVVIDAEYVGLWELPVLGAVIAPTAVLIRPDGYVAWVGDRALLGLPEALTTWFGPPTAA